MEFKTKPKYGLMPFLFNIYSKDLESEGAEYRYSIVKIAECDGIQYSSRWMDDPDLPDGKCSVPDVDLTQEEFMLYSQEEAYDLIRAWWSQK